MSIMRHPEFSAEASLYRSKAHYLPGQYGVQGADIVVPAIPFCGNCDWILDRCEQNGWRPERYVTPVR